MSDLIERLQALHVMLEQGLDPKSPFTNWVTDSPYLNDLTAFSQKVFAALEQEIRVKRK